MLGDGPRDVAAARLELLAGQTISQLVNGLVIDSINRICERSFSLTCAARGAGRAHLGTVRVSLDDIVPAHHP